MRPAFLRFAVLAAVWMAALGAVMVVCGLLLDAPWNIVPAAFGTGLATLAAALELEQLLAQG